jgi:hypothetical protein
MGNVLDKFITPMRPFFADPKMPAGTPVEAFYAGLIEDLSIFSDTVLELASKNLRAGREYHTFPSIAECMGYCKAARDELYGKTIANAPPKEPYPEWTKERQTWAAQVLCGGQGRRYSISAARDGWIVALWDFVREKERLPNDREADEIRRKHRNRERWFEENGIGNWGPMRKAMLDRKEALSKMVAVAAEEDRHAAQNR